MEQSLKSAMSSDLITVKSEDSLTLAYLKMSQNRIRHLPVTDSSGRLVGIISDRDLLRAAKSNHPTKNNLDFESFSFDPRQRVIGYMSWPVKSVDKKTSLHTLAQRMINEKISSFVITEENVPVGIITTEDLLNVLCDLMDKPESKLRWTLENLLHNPTFGKVVQSISDAGI